MEPYSYESHQKLIMSIHVRLHLHHIHGEQTRMYMFRLLLLRTRPCTTCTHEAGKSHVRGEKTQEMLSPILIQRGQVYRDNDFLQGSAKVASRRNHFLEPFCLVLQTATLSLCLPASPVSTLSRKDVKPQTMNLLTHSWWHRWNVHSRLFLSKNWGFAHLRELEVNSTVNWMSSHETWGIFAAKLKARSVKLHLPGPELRPSMSSIHHSRPLSKSLQSSKIKLCQTIWHAPQKKLPPSSTAHNLAAILAPICTPSEDFSTIWRPAQSTDGGLMTCEACLGKPTNRESSGEKSNF